MVTQYPDSIEVTWTPELIQNEETGYFDSVAEPSLFQSKCRAQFNSSGKPINGPDGSILSYSFKIYMPKTDVIIPFDAAYTLTKGAKTFTGKVILSDNGSFNSTIWV